MVGSILDGSYRRLQGAVCEALGKIGTGKSIHTLNKLEKSIKSPLILKVKEALKKIGERAAITTREKI